MYRYEIVIRWSEEDDAYVAEVPELPECYANGRTYREALENVQPVIAGWIENAKALGRPVPAPKTSSPYA